MVRNKFEATWEDGPKSSRLIARRNDAFDFRAGLFHSTIEWTWEPLGATGEQLPTPQWVRQALSSFVRDEFGARTTTRPFPRLTARNSVECSLRDIALEYQSWAERNHVYDERSQTRLSDLLAREPEPRNRLHELLVSSPIGARENRKNLSALEFQNEVLPSVDLRVGARLIAMGLPFRDQNPFRTNDLPAAPSMAEAAFLIHMHTAALALYQVLPSGSTVTIVADGRFYANVLGTSIEAAESYFHNLRKLRSDLNMQGTVSIIDLKALVDRFSQRQGSRHLFDDTVSEIECILKREGTEDQEYANLIRSISLGIRWNYSTREIVANLDPIDVWRWLHGEVVTGSAFDKLNSIVESAAVTYAAMNLALRFYAVVPTMLPGYIRASIHPKHLQVGLARLGSVSPWNGVAYLRDGTLPSLRTMPLYEVPGEAKEYRSSDYAQNSIVMYG